MIIRTPLLGGSLISNVFQLLVLKDIIVQSSRLTLGEFSYLFINRKVIPQIILVLHIVYPNLHYVFKHVLYGLETHL